MARRQDTTLDFDFQEVQSSVNDVYSSSSKREQYTKFSETGRFDIGKYASEQGQQQLFESSLKNSKHSTKVLSEGFAEITTSK